MSLASMLDKTVEQRNRADRYARDPFAELEDGLVKVFDLETQREVVLTPTDGQVEIVRAWVDLDHLTKTGDLRLRDTRVEKTRQVRGSTIGAHIVRWAVSYHPIRIGVLNQKQSEVDDTRGGAALGTSTPNSFFGKVRQQWESMPPDVRAPLRFTGFSGSIPAMITNTARPTVSYVVGSGHTPSPFRGWTLGGIFWDEAAHYIWSELAHQSMAFACPSGKCYLSSAFGRSGCFARLRAPDSTEDQWQRLRLHWSQDPVYSVGLHVAGTSPTCEHCQNDTHRYPGRLTSTWYEKAISGKTDEQIATELDIDYGASLTGRVYTEWSPDRHVVDGPARIDPNLQGSLAFDYGLDVTSILIMQESPSEVRVLGVFEAANETPDEIVPGLKALLLSLGASPASLEPDVIGAAWPGEGDPAGKSRELSTARSVVSEYEKHGFVIRSKQRSVDETIRATKRLLLGKPKRLVVPRQPSTELFIAHIEGNRYPVDREGKRRPGNLLPIDDEHNHCMRAFSYWVANRYPIRAKGGAFQVVPR